MNTKQIRQAVLERDEGRCVVTGEYLVDVDTGNPFGQFSVHHRTPRGMGGSKDPKIASVSNLLLLSGTGTTGAHGKIESNRSWAVDEGFIVPRWQDPALVPVNHYRHGLAWATPWGTWMTVFRQNGETKSTLYLQALAEWRRIPKTDREYLALAEAIGDVVVPLMQAS